ncbi:MAG TPA: RDD family protein [Pirellulaceae bacterium]|nr:RDD family protein [Pirellulaceae bacterium]
MAFSTPRFSGPHYGAQDPRLANRWKRFLGSLIDSLLYMGIGMIVGFGMAGSTGSVNENELFLVVAVFILVAFGVQAYLISTRGQSLGKIVLGTRIVRVETDETVGFLHGVLLRAIVPAFIGMVPFVGRFFGLIDALFIFGEEKRCIHDLIAGTKVLDIELITTHHNNDVLSGNYDRRY